MSRFAVAFVVLIAIGCSPSPAPQTLQSGPATPAASTSPSPVDLADSFLIPQKEGAGLSHTPSVVFTSDGRRMVTATSDREIVEFDVATRKLLRKIAFPEEVTDAVSIDAAARHAVWVLKKGGLVVMDLRLEKTVARDDALASTWVAVSPDGSRLAVSSGKQITLRHLPSLKKADELPSHGEDVTNLAWSRDGRLLGSTSRDGTIRIRDMEKKKTTYEAKKPGPLYALAFHPDGTFAAYGGEEKKIYQVEFATGKEDVIAANQPYWITCLGYSQDGSRLAAGDESCDIWLFTLKDKTLAFHSKHHVECWLSSIAWAPDRETFLFGCRPNAHAGRPSLWVGNQRAEAARSGAVRQSRTAVLRKIEEELARTKDPETKKALDDYRSTLAKEESLQTTNQFGGWGEYQVDGAYFESSTAVLAGAPIDSKATASALVGGKVHNPSSAPSKLPASVQSLAQNHEAELQKEMKKLGSAFYCVNQYSIKK